MAIVHELSWSVSRAGTFRACRRKYYIDYYLSWRGWERTAPEERKRAYLLKKMTRLPMLAGDCLHTALEGWFKAKAEGRALGPEEVTQAAVTRMREGYKTSRDGLWRSQPSKLTHLAEHHYGEDRIDEASGAAGEYGTRYRKRIEEGVQAFFEMPELAEVRDADPKDYLALEEMGTIELFGTKAFAIPDFAFRRARNGEREIMIYDWKTGNPREQDRFQLAVYVFYAGEKWGAKPDECFCVDAYLPTRQLERMQFSEADMEPVMDRVETTLAEMRAVHFDADQGMGDAEEFPMVE
ncbi:MAG: PD-(D/E)XK nuclease family protein, partial [Planctomycetes bacterium]|nr:PD-(D/E)XK nuclease family protein [Planctomycetota bacterium]